MVSVFLPTSRIRPVRSRAAYAAANAGKAAIENATPMRLTGTFMKLRARLTVVMLPAASAEATLVKNRNVIGSIGLDTVLGSISRKNSRTEAVRSSSASRGR